MPSFDAGQTGITPGVTILTTAGAVHTARATAGITEPVTGSGVYHFAHPDPGTLLLFVFDIGDGEVGASVWDDGVSAASQASVDAVASAIAALPGAQVGTRIDETSTDSDGGVLGVATAGSTITAYLATDTDRAEPVRQTTAAPDGSWALYLPAGTYTLVVTLDGYYDAAEGDSEITRTVTVA
jgi:hypothetical protein